MPKESDLQAKIIKWLRSKGCVAMKLAPGMGIPRGTPDILFLKEGLWGFLECKRAKNAPKQPGQQQMVDKLNEWSYARFVSPENLEEVQRELEELLR